MSEVTIEFYGVPRQRAGRAELAVEADSARTALVRIAEACPGLGPLLGPGGELLPQYRLAIDAERFLIDLSEPLSAGTRLLLMSADAGG